MCGTFRWFRIGLIAWLCSVPSDPTFAKIRSCSSSWLVNWTVFAGLYSSS
jgi:hypothetical protein